MELIFNELSEMPLCPDRTKAFERVELFIETYKSIKYRFDYNKIRFHAGFESILLTADYSLNDYCNETKHYRTKGLLLRGLIRMPFIDDNTEEEEKYIESSFCLNKCGTIIKPYGLAAAFLYSEPAIGFLSEDFWKNCIFEMTVQKFYERTELVYCLSKPDHAQDTSVINFIEENLPIELLESRIKYADKRFELRDDHGKDKLTAFSKRIIASKYVNSVINSLPFNSSCNRFIKKIYPDGKIEIVLTDTDKGLGIIIQTTGRNLKETKAIADILGSEYN